MQSRLKLIGVVLGFQVAVATTQGQSPTDCRLARASGESDVAYATRCAEHFVRAAGYTSDTAAVDSTLFVRDIIEFGGRDQVFATRAGTLRPRSVFAGCAAEGCLVGFAYADKANVCRARGVQMGTGFTALRVAHQDLIYDGRSRWRRFWDRMKPGPHPCAAT